MNGETVARATRQMVKPEVVADYLKVSRNTVLNWARSGKIPCIQIEKTYRFDWNQILEFFASCQSN